MNTAQNLAELIQKFEAGTASQEEINLINEWYHSFDDSVAQVNTGEVINEEQLAGRMRARLLETISDGSLKRVVPLRKRWKQVAAAIALLCLLGTAAYLLFGTGKETKIPGQPVAIKPQPSDEIKPGGDIALLTLADGSVIVLDSASDGLLGIQGNTKIEKLENGLLVYKVNGQTVTENDEAFYNTITTPRGGQYQVTLSDGTKVWLNAASSIRFPVFFTGSERKVEVTGETYFEVAKNEKLPFKVKAVNSEVEVLGTHFNINAYDDEASIKTTLLEGKVKISVPSAGQAASYLLPGQQSGISKAGKISVLDHADTEEAVAWKNGRFQFKSADLRSILRQIARWYDVDIEYKGAVDLHFTGQLTRNDNVSKVFEKLQLTGEVHFRTEGRKIIVSR